MITVKPKFDGSNGIIFECSEKDEYDYLNSHAHEILDKFVQTRIKNIGCLKIETYNDYVDFCRSSPKKQLEMIEGHAIKYKDFEDIGLKNAFILSHEVTKELAFTDATFNSLQSLANDMFEEWRSK